MSGRSYPPFLSELPSMPYIVQLQPGCWLAAVNGDPGRTIVKKNAKAYSTQAGAKIALGLARRRSPFASARIIAVGESSRRGKCRNCFDLFGRFNKKTKCAECAETKCYSCCPEYADGKRYCRNCACEE